VYVAPPSGDLAMEIGNAVDDRHQVGSLKIAKCLIGLAFPARQISHRHAFGGCALFFTTTE
jgi:hypothetical protein